MKSTISRMLEYSKEKSFRGAKCVVGVTAVNCILNLIEHGKDYNFCEELIYKTLNALIKDDNEGNIKLLEIPHDISNCLFEIKDKYSDSEYKTRYDNILNLTLLIKSFIIYRQIMNEYNSLSDDMSLGYKMLIETIYTNRYDSLLLIYKEEYLSIINSLLTICDADKDGKYQSMMEEIIIAQNEFYSHHG